MGFPVCRIISDFNNSKPTDKLLDIKLNFTTFGLCLIVGLSWLLNNKGINELKVVEAKNVFELQLSVYLRNLTVKNVFDGLLTAYGPEASERVLITWSKVCAKDFLNNFQSTVDKFSLVDVALALELMKRMRIFYRRIFTVLDCGFFTENTLLAPLLLKLLELADNSTDLCIQRLESACIVMPILKTFEDSLSLAAFKNCIGDLRTPIYQLHTVIAKLAKALGNSGNHNSSLEYHFSAALESISIFWVENKKYCDHYLSLESPSRFDPSVVDILILNAIHHEHKIACEISSWPDDISFDELLAKIDNGDFISELRLLKSTCWSLRSTIHSKIFMDVCYFGIENWSTSNLNENCILNWDMFFASNKSSFISAGKNVFMRQPESLLWFGTFFFALEPNAPCGRIPFCFNHNYIAGSATISTLVSVLAELQSQSQVDKVSIALLDENSYSVWSLLKSDERRGKLSVVYLNAAMIDDDVTFVVHAFRKAFGIQIENHIVKATFALPAELDPEDRANFFALIAWILRYSDNPSDCSALPFIIELKKRAAVISTQRENLSGADIIVQDIIRALRFESDFTSGIESIFKFETEKVKVLTSLLPLLKTSARALRNRKDFMSNPVTRSFRGSPINKEVASQWLKSPKATALSSLHVLVILPNIVSLFETTRDSNAVRYGQRVHAYKCALNALERLNRVVVESFDRPLIESSAHCRTISAAISNIQSVCWEINRNLVEPASVASLIEGEQRGQDLNVLLDRKSITFHFEKGKQLLESLGLKEVADLFEADTVIQACEDASMFSDVRGLKTEKAERRNNQSKSADLQKRLKDHIEELLRKCGEETIRPLEIIASLRTLSIDCEKAVIVDQENGLVAEQLLLIEQTCLRLNGQLVAFKESLNETPRGPDRSLTQETNQMLKVFKELLAPSLMHGRRNQLTGFAERSISIKGELERIKLDKNLGSDLSDKTSSMIE
jgi:hypothetical protein